MQQTRDYAPSQLAAKLIVPAYWRFHSKFSVYAVVVSGLATLTMAGFAVFAAVRLSDVRIRLIVVPLLLAFVTGHLYARGFIQQAGSVFNLFPFRNFWYWRQPTTFEIEFSKKPAIQYSYFFVIVLSCIVAVSTSVNGYRESFAVNAKTDALRALKQIVQAELDGRTDKCISGIQSACAEIPPARDQLNNVIEVLSNPKAPIVVHAPFIPAVEDFKSRYP